MVRRREALRQVELEMFLVRLYQRSSVLCFCYPTRQIGQRGLLGSADGFSDAGIKAEIEGWVMGYDYQYCCTEEVLCMLIWLDVRVSVWLGGGGCRWHRIWEQTAHACVALRCGPRSDEVLLLIGWTSEI